MFILQVGMKNLQMLFYYKYVKIFYFLSERNLGNLNKYIKKTKLRDLFLCHLLYYKRVPMFL